VALMPASLNWHLECCSGLSDRFEPRPRPGLDHWGMTVNYINSMACESMTNMPLNASQEDGMLEIAVGGEQDRMPMMINFSWQLNSAESINGDLRSEVTQQGMMCLMSQPFEMSYTRY
jgi:hypothetical protein